MGFVSRTTVMLIKSFFKHYNHYSAVLPYNLNWQIGNLAAVADFLTKNPITVVDVGARGTVPGEIGDLKRFIRYYGFEADREECERINQNPPKGFYAFSMFPYIIGDAIGRQQFNLFKERAQSSILAPNERYTHNYSGDSFSIEATIETDSNTLDNLLKLGKFEAPDILKLDTQGSEFNIIESSPLVLSNTPLVESEVEFTQMYEGQHLFHDICALMYAQDYELLFLNRVFAQRLIYNGVSRGQTTFGDALFGKREDKLQGLDPQRIAKYIILLINYGHIDLAYQIYLLYPDIDRLAPSLKGFFRQGHGSRLKQLTLSQLDKLVCLILHARKYNQLKADSDRSWPTR